MLSDVAVLMSELVGTMAVHSKVARVPLCVAGRESG